MKQFVRQIPAVHELQHDLRFIELREKSAWNEQQLTKWMKEIINELRTSLLEETWEGNVDDFTNDILAQLHEVAAEKGSYQLKHVINGTGTVLHTNLGRARLSERAIEHVKETAEHYTNLEYDLRSGKRGSRHAVIEQLLCEATGAESAMVVNNNAAAVYLILKAFAKEKEVIVSRGQLVEIGGSFRVSSIMEESGAKLVEVGTTNKTHLYDYERAITDETAMVMKVHTSNFKTIGFTAEVDTKRLVELAKQRNIMLYEDLGSGALYDYAVHGIGEEPLVRDVLEAGVDLVSFSGDKLLGGPQAGIIAGKKSLIDRLKKHQLARVLRVDKMTLAALESTILPYVLGGEAIKEIPAVRDLLASKEEIYEKAGQFIEAIQACKKLKFSEMKEELSQIGGGTMPGVDLSTWAVCIQHEDMNAQELSDELRKQTPSIVCRIKHEQVMIDFRTIAQTEMSVLIERMCAVLN
ncbi:L-seryl-tRNA(Sec) selenium transferase [Bacillus tianshenii]|nr:L-seryl-tRNA(Sec) selenium transferase [Bacillus tianshenii]